MERAPERTTGNRAAVSPHRRPRVALIRGRYLNGWEGQSFEPLLDRYEIMGVTSHRPDFDLSQLPFAHMRLFAPGQRLEGKDLFARLLRKCVARPVDEGVLRGLTDGLRDFDLLHSAETHTGFSEQAARAGVKHDIPLVLTCWENIPFAYYEYPAYRARKILVRRAADRFMAATPSAAEALRQEGVEDRRIRVVMPGVDLRRFFPAPRDGALLQRLGIPADCFVILYVGRLIREKGLLYLLLAAGRMVEATGCGVGIRFLLVGEGAYQPALAAIAREVGLNDYIQFAGSRSYAELPALYRSADVFVLPSIPTPYWQEQFGMVLAEAMACGCPVVSTRSGSIPEVTGDAATLVEPFDAAALSGALLRLWRERTLREEMASRAHARAEACFDSRLAAARIAEVYDELLGMRRRESGSVGETRP